MVVGNHRFQWVNHHTWAIFHSYMLNYQRAYQSESRNLLGWSSHHSYSINKRNRSVKYPYIYMYIHQKMTCDIPSHSHYPIHINPQRNIPAIDRINPSLLLLASSGPSAVCKDQRDGDTAETGVPTAAPECSGESCSEAAGFMRKMMGKWSINR